MASGVASRTCDTRLTVRRRLAEGNFGLRYHLGLVRVELCGSRLQLDGPKVARVGVQVVLYIAVILA